MSRRLAVAILAVAFVAVPAAAHAAPARQVIQGEVLRLESIQDVAAMSAMMPGAPVAWDVGVSASRPDGDIALRLEVDATDGAFAAAVSSCGVAWDADGCATGATLLADAALVDGVVDLGDQPSSEVRWYRILVELTADVGDRRAELVLHADGLGDQVASGGEVELPPTGIDAPGLGMWLAGGAIVAGVALAAAATRRRRREVEA